MSGFKEANTQIGITIQPTLGVYNEPTAADIMAVFSPTNASEAITADDNTVTGAIWAAPRQFLGRRGRAGASFYLRGPGGVAPPGAGGWVPGRVLQAVSFTEVINPTAITATAQAGGSASAIQLSTAQSAVDDFYMGYPIQHPTIGSGRARGTSIIRDYDGASRTATLCETMGSAVTGGSFTIPAFLGYILGTGASVPLLSAKVWRHKKSYRYRDCAVSSFAINIPTANDQNTDSPSIEFGLVGIPEVSVDENVPPLPSSLLTAIPKAKAGKFALAGLKIGHQSMRLEFGLQTGAPPNVNFDAGQEANEILSGTRQITLDVNEQLKATLDFDALVDAQTPTPIIEAWGAAAGQTWAIAALNTLLDAFSPQPRNGFIGLTGGAGPLDADRGVSLCSIY